MKGIQRGIGGIGTPPLADDTLEDEALEEAIEADRVAEMEEPPAPERHPHTVGEEIDALRRDLDALTGLVQQFGTNLHTAGEGLTQVMGQMAQVEGFAAKVNTWATGVDSRVKALAERTMITTRKDALDLAIKAMGGNAGQDFGSKVVDMAMRFTEFLAPPAPPIEVPLSEPNEPPPEMPPDAVVGSTKH